MRGKPIKIAVIRFSSIGDIVLTLPAVHELRRLNPYAEIHYITKTLFAPIISEDPAVTKVHTLPVSGDIEPLIEMLAAQSFDLIVDLHDSIRSRLICSRLKKPVKRYRKDRLRRLIRYLLLKKREKVVPIWQRYCAAFATSGMVPDFTMHLPRESLIRASSIIGDTPSLVIAPGSTWATKEWPLEKYRELAQLLMESTFPVVVVGGEKDRAVQELFAAILGDRVIGLAGALSITESAAVVSKAAMVLTVDTGMMHIASAYERPSIVLFGSTVQEFGFFPASTRAIVLERDVSCRPCSSVGRSRCPRGHFRCMNEISAESVASLIVRHFEGVRS